MTDIRQRQESEYKHQESFEEETAKTATVAAEESKNGNGIYLGVLALVFGCLSPLFAFLLIAYLHDIGNWVESSSAIYSFSLIYWIYAMPQRNSPLLLLLPLLIFLF